MLQVIKDLEHCGCSYVTINTHVFKSQYFLLSLPVQNYMRPSFLTCFIYKGDKRHNIV